MPLNTDCLNRTYGPESFTVEAEHVERFAAATLVPPVQVAPGRRQVPPAFAFVPCWPIILSALDDPDLGNAPNQIIHGEQHMHFERALRVGDRLTTVGTVTTIEPKGRNELYVVELESKDSETGELVVRQQNVCVSLGSAAEENPAPPKSSRPATKPERPAPSRRTTVELPADITRRYADASGDHNAVHTDADAAIALGFPGIIVHGMCLLAVAANGALDTTGNGTGDRHVKQLSVRFANPVQPGERLETRYWDNGHECDFEAVSGDGRRALANGKVVLSQ